MIAWEKYQIGNGGTAGLLANPTRQDEEFTSTMSIGKPIPFVCNRAVFAGIARPPTMPSPTYLALLLGLCLVVPSCRSGSRLAKAFPAPPSPFLVHAEDLRATDAAQSPFLRQWRNPDEALWQQATEARSISIAPIELGHLRPITRALSKLADSDSKRRLEARQLAKRLRDDLGEAFKNLEPSWQLHQKDAPAPTDLWLEVAMVEFNPNAVLGGLARKGINILLWPGAETAVSHKLKGSMAIEGRLRLGEQGPILLEFSDAEQVRSGIILHYHDYTNYSYFRKLCREWGGQIAEVVAKQAKGGVKDSLPATLLLW